MNPKYHETPKTKTHKNKFPIIFTCLFGENLLGVPPFSIVPRKTPEFKAAAEGIDEISRNSLNLYTVSYKLECRIRSRKYAYHLHQTNIIFIMIPRKRKGMIIRNANKKDISVKLEERELVIPPGDCVAVSSQEVMDNALRDLLQVRDLVIERPLTEKENREMQNEIAGRKRKKKTA